MEPIFTNYRNLVTELETFVLNNCDLQYEQNPFIQSKLPRSVLKRIIKEYSQFSNEAIHMLLDARIRVYEWKKLAAEIDSNIEEEKGLKTRGIPHLEIMRRGYLADFNFDVNNYSPSIITSAFLDDLRKIFRKKDNAYLAGALLAFESVSIPEFNVLDSLVTRCTEVRSVNTDMYIEGHKLFEIGHKEGLMSAIEGCIGADNAFEFSSGYLEVCKTISNWWNDLYDVFGTNL